jgi:hypothetical protein
MNKIRFSALAGMVLAAAASRLIPHPPTFTPIAAIALFGGAQFADRRAAFLVPFCGLLLSDCVLGFHALMPIIYGAFALIVWYGTWFCRQRSVSRIAIAAIVSALLFFVITNLGVWAFGTLYPKTLTGLMECYVAAIPFFGNMLLSDLLYSALLFGGLAMAERRFTQMRQMVPSRVNQPT